jgi:hypothetical protein
MAVEGHVWALSNHPEAQGLVYVICFVLRANKNESAVSLQLILKSLHALKTAVKLECQLSC